MSTASVGEISTVQIPPFEDPRSVLARHGFVPKKRFSQNFLVNPGVIERIAEQVVRDATNAHVIELGPGAGTLTCALLRKGANVLAIEQDNDMLQLLASEIHTPKFILESGDAADFSLTETAQRLFGATPVGKPLLCGNLPYAITGTIFRNLFRQSRDLERAVFMVQKEVAERLVAPSGGKTYGALSACVQAIYHVRTAFKVSRGSFHPVPNVDSAVVVLQPLTSAIPTSLATYEATVRLGFGKRRKTLLNALADGHPKPHIEKACLAVGIDPSRRAETLTPVEFNNLAEQLGAPTLLDVSKRG